MAKVDFNKLRQRIEKIANIDQNDKDNALKAIDALNKIYQKGIPFVQGFQIAPELALELTKALVSHKPNPKVGQLARKLAKCDNTTEKEGNDLMSGQQENVLDPKLLTTVITNRIETRRANIENKDKKHSHKMSK